ncbi:hypothetical protein ACIQ2D_21925, partial [Lysinibacillus sp. NPDC097287]
DDFIRDSNNTEVLGIRIGDWHSFLRMHSDQADLDTVSAKMRIELEKRVSKISEKDASFLISTLLLAKEILKDV